MAAPVAAADLPVDLELVLAVDISGSVDAEEARQQREGYIAAISDAAVIQAIGANYYQRIAVAYLEWAGSDFQRLVLDWTLISGAADAERFARQLAATPYRRGRWTSISGAIDAASPLFDGNGYAGERRVIDISGDGTNNRGRPVEDARDQAVAAGIVINGLPILNNRPQPFRLPTPMDVSLDTYYAESVIGGPGSFVQPAMDFADFRIAILNKLIREIAGNEAPVRAAQRYTNAASERSIAGNASFSTQ